VLKSIFFFFFFFFGIGNAIGRSCTSRNEYGES
jgi:hypothetical protein